MRYSMSSTLLALLSLALFATTVTATECRFYDYYADQAKRKPDVHFNNNRWYLEKNPSDHTQYFEAGVTGKSSPYGPTVDITSTGFTLKSSKGTGQMMIIFRLDSQKGRFYWLDAGGSCDSTDRLVFGSIQVWQVTSHY
jgi:hypothetical protein